MGKRLKSVPTEMYSKKIGFFETQLELPLKH